MGDFSAEIRIGNLTGSELHPVTALVDATESAFPADLLEWLHIPATAKPMDYIRADGSVLECPRGFARISITVRSGEILSGICPVAFWPDESGQCVGATTLQILTLAVDAANDELAPVAALRRGWPGDPPILPPKERMTMTTPTIDVAAVFSDAREMHAAALERLAQDDIRDAAEKAWCAAKRATDALILARTGSLPPRSPDTTRGLRTLAAADPAFRSLRDRYFERQAALHGDCFYTGWCEPIADTELLIHQTIEYIRDAESLA